MDKWKVEWDSHDIAILRNDSPNHSPPKTRTPTRTPHAILAPRTSTVISPYGGTRTKCPACGSRSDSSRRIRRSRCPGDRPPHRRQPPAAAHPSPRHCHPPCTSRRCRATCDASPPAPPDADPPRPSRHVDTGCRPCDPLHRHHRRRRRHQRCCRHRRHLPPTDPDPITYSGTANSFAGTV